MQKLVFSVIVLSFFISCKKNKSETPPPPSDSLAAGWTRIDPGFTNNLTDIFFIGNTGFFVVDNLIYRSTDGGDTWQKVYTANNAMINISMGSTNNAVFVASSTSSNRTAYLTKDGGNTFDSVYIANAGISDVFFVSPDVAYAIGNDFYKSFDGGKNWTLIHDFSPVSNYTTLHFLNEQNGWIITPNGLLKTSNGGVNWDPVSATGFTFANPNSIFLSDANTIYFSADGKIGVSKNGGTSWTALQGTAGGGFKDLHFITNDIGYLSENSTIYKTTDGGTNWKVEVQLGLGNFIEIHFTDANHGWGVGPFGALVKYEN